MLKRRVLLIDLGSSAALCALLRRDAADAHRIVAVRHEEGINVPAYSYVTITGA